MAIRTRAPAPTLILATLDGGTFDLRASAPRTFTMIVFYRGIHCGYCRRYLQDLDPQIEAFTRQGVVVVAASCDDRERAERARKDWGLKNICLAYGMSLATARDWGLFISTGIKDDQPTYFSEPGLFLVEPDGTLYAAYIQTLPFARPRISDVLAAIEFVTRRKKPARGEVVLDDASCGVDPVSGASAMAGRR